MSELLNEHKWVVSRFTARETRKARQQILERFAEGKIDGLVAIKCLDEGIDIPSCHTAYILASSRSDRQFIQRRGRILRKSDGKDFATIHDLVITLPQGIEDESGYARNLLKAELNRVGDFAGMSKNRPEAYDMLKDVLEEYGLEHLV